MLLSDSSKLGRYLGLVVDITRSRSLEGVAGLCPEAGCLVLEGRCGLPAVHVQVLVEVYVGPHQPPVAGLARTQVTRQRSAGVLLKQNVNDKKIPALSVSMSGNPKCIPRDHLKVATKDGWF